MPGGPGGFERDSTRPVLLWYTSQRLFQLSRTGLSPSMVGLSRAVSLAYFNSRCPQPQSEDWFGLFRFRSPLLTESISVSFPLGTKMFQFPRFALPALYIQAGVKECYSNGFPHSDISGSTFVCQLAGAYRRLPRLSSPLDAKTSTIYP